MANARDVGAEMAGVMSNLSRTLKASTRAALKDAGNTAKRNLQDSGRARTGGDLRFSNFRGPKLGVKARVSDEVVTVSPSGAWGILEPGAKRHAIGKRGRLLRINGGVRRGPVNHPGTADTAAWSKGRDETFRAVERELPEQIGNAAEGVFGG